MTPCFRTLPRGARLGPRPFAVLLALLICAFALPASGALAASPAPTVSTSNASNATYSSAIVYGHVNPNGLATGYYFQYGTTTAYGAQTPLAPAGNGTISVKLSQTITGLQPATTYHYRIVATNSAGTA